MNAEQNGKAAQDMDALLRQYECGPIKFSGGENALYDRQLLFDLAIDPAVAGPRERYEAIARSVQPWARRTAPRLAWASG